MKKRISLFMAAIMVLTVMLSAIPIAAATNTFNASDAYPLIYETFIDKMEGKRD